ncbi:vWA domain-containing protein [Dyadobacter tibetensis]|uniref:vWA domain-containing protein n=1 Tax=Dyadobacter tibetensis TaxID=1211851 RepID=UPI0004700510|nr:VWA domain-containing protein [Dyadobacter tibetensis]
MNWNYLLGVTEYFFIFLFITLYIIYIFRTVRVAHQLRTTARSLVVKLVLRSGAFSLLIISLLGPSFGEAQKEVKGIGKDIYVLVDLSLSMQAPDVTPNRLEKVKFELNRFVESQAANRIGIIVYSNNAYVQVPLTYDKDALKAFVQSLQTDLIPGNGSDLCTALQLAFNKMTGDASPEERSKMLVIFTDGEQSAQCSGALYNNIRRYGIAVEAVGVGTLTGSSIKVGKELLRNEDGDVVVSRLEEKFLKNLVSQVKGNYFILNNITNEMEAMVQAVNNTTGSFVDTRTLMIDTNKYYYFLGAALVLVLMDVLITIGTFRL